MAYEFNATDTPLTELPDESVIWRYMDLWKFIDMLDRRVFFASINTFKKGDPYEGDFPTRIKGPLRKSIDAIHKRARTWVFASCWHINTIESAAMWAQYTKQGEGVVIKSTLKRLKDSFENEERGIRVSKIEYCDYDKDDPVDKDRIYLHKKKSYQHEAELRAFTCPWTLEPPKGTKETPGIAVEVIPKQLIEDVFIGPKCDDWLRTTVDAALRSFGLHKIKCKQSSLIKTS